MGLSNELFCEAGSFSHCLNLHRFFSIRGLILCFSIPGISFLTEEGKKGNQITLVLPHSSHAIFPLHVFIELKECCGPAGDEGAVAKA